MTSRLEKARLLYEAVGGNYDAFVQRSKEEINITSLGATTFYNKFRAEELNGVGRPVRSAVIEFLNAPIPYWQALVLVAGGIAVWHVPLMNIVAFLATVLYLHLRKKK